MMSKNNGNTVLVMPMSIPEETDKRVKKIQDFLQWTTGIRPTKPEACALLLEAGLPAYEKKMKSYIK